MICHSFLQWTTFCQNSPPWPVYLGWPYRAWLSFIELDRPVVHVISMASFLWLWFQSACPLMPSLSACCFTGVSLTLNMGYLLSTAHCLLDVTGDRSKVRCRKEQYCIGTWYVRSRNQDKLEVVKQEMVRVDANILGISKLKWTGMGEFNSDDHYVCYCG